MKELPATFRKGNYPAKTWAQLEKDWYSAATGMDFPEYPGPDLIFPAVSACLERLWQENPSAFSSLMYRVDMPSEVLDQWQRNSPGDFALLAEWVVRREFLKVFTRHHYKNRGED